MSLTLHDGMIVATRENPKQYALKCQACEKTWRADITRGIGPALAQAMRNHCEEHAQDWGENEGIDLKATPPIAEDEGKETRKQKHHHGKKHHK